MDLQLCLHLDHGPPAIKLTRIATEFDGLEDNVYWIFKIVKLSISIRLKLFFECAYLSSLSVSLPLSLLLSLSPSQYEVWPIIEN